MHRSLRPIKESSKFLHISVLVHILHLSNTDSKSDPTCIGINFDDTRVSNSIYNIQYVLQADDGLKILKFAFGVWAIGILKMNYFKENEFIVIQKYESNKRLSYSVLWFGQKKKRDALTWYYIYIVEWLRLSAPPSFILFDIITTYYLSNFWKQFTKIPNIGNTGRVSMTQLFILISNRCIWHTEKVHSVVGLIYILGYY